MMAVAPGGAGTAANSGCEAGMVAPRPVVTMAGAPVMASMTVMPGVAL